MVYEHGAQMDSSWWSFHQIRLGHQNVYNLEPTMGTKRSHLVCHYQNIDGCIDLHPRIQSDSKNL